MVAEGLMGMDMTALTIEYGEKGCVDEEQSIQQGFSYY